MAVRFPGPVLPVLLLVACSSPSSPVDAGALPLDSGTPDAGRVIAEPFEVTGFTSIRIGSLSTDEHPQSATTPDFEFRDGPYEKATLIIDLASTCYPFEGWAQNPPPSGQNWPADCDAFDRNFELTLDEPGPDGGTPAVELVRAITPFGGPLHLEVDITDLANGLPGKHTLTVRIPTYSDSAGKVSGSHGGWNVSAKAALKPGAAPRPVLAVIPLLNRNDTTGAEPAVGFTLPAGVVSTALQYRVTGHGGASDPSGACIGPAEEFCQRTHQLFGDDAALDTLNPWRDDCATLCTLTPFPTGFATGSYCKENPCGSVQSVRAPRANWCPGSMTPPFIEDSTLWRAAGPHTFRYSIANVKAGGVWRVSAVLIVYGQ